MTEALIIALICLSIAAVIMLIVLLTRGSHSKLLRIESRFDSFEKNQERTERTIRDEISKNRDDVANSVKNSSDSQLQLLNTIASLQADQLKAQAEQIKNLAQTNEQRLNDMRNTVERKLELIQQDNSQKLEQMRKTVDEKLHETLEKRLGDSFKTVSERLEKVHEGLGAMQTMATDLKTGLVDLNKVMSNVKNRGIWGEIQLGNLLEQILIKDQYAVNVVTKKGSSERVEFAIKLPGRNAESEYVWLPIDAKFPQEDYLRLLNAQEQANPVLAEEAAKQIEARIKGMAKDIREKYLDPPHTTDFGIMFLATEGLYAEVLRRTGLCESLQRDFRVLVTGPMTIAALLNSLQMGFRTLAIEKRSSEVWALLGAIKTEFGKFGDILQKTHEKLIQAGNTIDSAAKKTRTIERKLKDVQELPVEETGKILGEPEAEDENS
jgi:DNA recombination protein RmuC